MNHSKGQRNDNYASGQVFNAKQQQNNAWQAPASESSSEQSNVLSFGHANLSTDSKFHAPDENSKSGILEQVGLNATPSLDAAQRKKLPAWIR